MPAGWLSLYTPHGWGVREVQPLLHDLAPSNNTTLVVKGKFTSGTQKSVLNGSVVMTLEVQRQKVSPLVFP